MIKFVSNLLETRKGCAIWSIIISVLLSLLLALPFSLLCGDFLGKFFVWSETMFVYFGAVCVVNAALLMFTRISDSLTYGYSLALYYGTIVTANIIKGLWYMPTEAGYVIGFVITALSCYIFWIRNHSSK